MKFRQNVAINSLHICCKLNINYIKSYTIRDLAPNRGSTNVIFPFHNIYLIIIEIAVSSVPCLSFSRLYMTPIFLHFIVKADSP
jgi:hypothetical protein